VSLVHYRSSDEDSARWQSFVVRDGDIVISTRSKSGTTWMQMICALLVFQTPQLPAPLGELSPWIDWLVVPWDEIAAVLDAQTHRRFVKTHTPLDGVPMDPRATYIVAARHPLDAAVSLYHQGMNLDRARIAELTGQPQPDRPAAPRPIAEWMDRWIDADDDPRDALDSLPGVMHHLTDAWARRDESNVVLVHYEDLSQDLGGEMRRLADHLRIVVPPDRWSELVDAARFESMRDRAAELAPDPNGVLKSRERFFRRGSSGAAGELLDDEQLGRYHARAAELAPPDLLSWLHRGR
jgi:aryl sulfotransferase